MSGRTSGRAPRLRIAGGLRRGMKLASAPGIRPTSSLLRQALFDIWSARLPGSSFLDLFAGSGAVGIEAASRGAGRVVLAEGDPAVHRLLERNIRSVDLPALTALRWDLPRDLARRLGYRFDLIFADPPYDFAAHRELLTGAEAHLEPGGEIALEHRWRDGEPQAPACLEAISRRRYGDSGLALYRRRP